MTTQPVPPRGVFDYMAGSRTYAPLPKPPTFNGECWKSFILRFELWGRQTGLSNEELAARFLLALTGKAAEFSLEIPSACLNNFEEMKLRFTQKFDRTLEPSTARALLHSAKQSSDEDLEDYADRIVKLVDVGYPATSSAERNKLSVEQFLKGCSDVRHIWCRCITQVLLGRLLLK